MSNMKQDKYLFIDRDGTLIEEPVDGQIDSLEKFSLMPGVISSLLSLKEAGYHFVMVSNQDGLGSANYPQEKYDHVQQLLLKILSSQGIMFESIRICPHTAENRCNCRKPEVGLVLDYLHSQKIDRLNSYVIGDRQSDLAFANNMGLVGIQLGGDGAESWQAVVSQLLSKPRAATVMKQTNETDICVTIELDKANKTEISTGIGFFDHMLSQLASHGGFGLKAIVKGDLIVDDHHTVEDTALAIGQAMQQALGDKRGIGRYGFILPMDESLAQVAIDICGRANFTFQGEFLREKVGELSTECVSHFFRSFAQSLGASLHIAVEGENTHHMVEAVFKGVGRTLRQAIAKNGELLPSTKGVL
jgi:imidazoleglycerol-phosphate dehydratase / histidinol-phosphatase